MTRSHSNRPVHACVARSAQTGNLLALAVFCAVGRLHGQTANVVAVPTTNINIDGDSTPANMTQVDGKLFFMASNKVGPGLYVENLLPNRPGTPTLLRSLPATVDQFVVKGPAGRRQLFFHVLNSGLWTTRGTANTTVLLRNTDEASPLQIPMSFLTTFKDLPTFNPSDAKLFFAAVASNGAYDLWSSNGTASGTKLYWNPNPGAVGDVYQISAIPYGMVDLGGTLVFAAVDFGIAAGNPFQIWSTHGTPTAKAPGDPLRLTSHLALEPHEITRTGTKDRPGGSCFFSSSGITNPGMRELWFTDGQGVSSTFCVTNGLNVNPVNLASFGGGVLFSGHDDTHGNELWISEKSNPVATTRLVADINGGPGDSNPRGIVNAGNKFAYFTASPDGVHDYLYRTDGTAKGTGEVAPAANALSTLAINRGHLANPSGTTPVLDANGSGTIFFAADDGNGNTILWETDNSAHAHALPVTTPGKNAIKNPAGMTAVTLASPQISRLYFSAPVSGTEFGDRGTELWVAPPSP